jgi:hypothetical protein
MKLVRDLEERNGSLSKRVEALEEERSALQVKTADAASRLLEKELVIQHLDRQVLVCAQPLCACLTSSQQLLHRVL